MEPEEVYSIVTKIKRYLYRQMQPFLEHDYMKSFKPRSKIVLENLL